MVIRPENTEEVVETVKVANKYRVPLIPRSAGTGFMGQSIPTLENTIMVDLFFDENNEDEINRCLEIQ